MWTTELLPVVAAPGTCTRLAPGERLGPLAQLEVSWGEPGPGGALRRAGDELGWSLGGARGAARIAGLRGAAHAVVPSLALDGIEAPGGAMPGGAAHVLVGALGEVEGPLQAGEVLLVDAQLQGAGVLSIPVGEGRVAWVFALVGSLLLPGGALREGERAQFEGRDSLLVRPAHDLARALVLVASR